MAREGAERRKECVGFDRKYGIWEESERRSRRLWLEGRRTDREKNDRQGEESEEGEDEGEGGLASTCP